MDSVGGIAITSFLVGLSGAVMPGPVLTVTISETAARLRAETPAAPGHAQVRGALVGPLIVLGHAILELVLVGAVVLGLGKLLIHGPVIGTIALLGGAVLVWMAWGMWRSAGSLSLRGGPQQAKRRHPVLAGLLTTLSNPYWIIWWASLGLGYIAISLRLGLAGLVSFYIGHILSDLLWYGSVSLTLAMGHRLLTDRAYRGVVVACAVFLLGFGVYFGYAGVRYLLA
jgi:threonine/homoserine/homoserine lactone efflux protein